MIYCRVATYFKVLNKNPCTSSVSSSSAFRTIFVSAKSYICFTVLVTEKSSSEWMIRLQLTIYFGVIHSFVFCAFDSQLNTIARQKHFLRLWMLHGRRSRAVIWMQQCSSLLTNMGNFLKSHEMMTHKKITDWYKSHTYSMWRLTLTWVCEHFLM